MRNDHIKRTVLVYDTIAKEYADKIEELAPKKELKKFVKMVTSGGRILDVGCAAGRDSFYFAQRGFKVTGVDLSEELLKIAMSRAPHIDFQKQDMRELDFPDGHFDGIWASASLLHLTRIEVPAVLNDFYKFLKANGILFILVKEGEGEADVKEELSEGLARHFTFFKQDELKLMLTQAGFKVEQIYAWNERDRHQKGRNILLISSFSRKPK